MDGVVTIILSLVLLLGLLAIVYVIYFNNIQADIIKINEAEGILDELLRKKYDNLILIKDVILEETDIDKKAFDKMVKLKDQNISSFDFERSLTEFNNLIDKMRLDYDVLNDDTRFSNYYEELFVINEKIEATKSFYNKYTNLLNNSIKKFPSNIIAAIHKVKVRHFFDGKDMFDDDINDFKL